MDEAKRPQFTLAIELEIVSLNILNKGLDFILVKFFQSLSNHSILIVLQLLCLMFRAHRPITRSTFSLKERKKMCK